MILVDPHMYHQAVVIQGTNITTATGRPVVLIDGELFVVTELPKTAAELVAQTFDEGAHNARIAGRNGNPAAAQTTTGSSHTDPEKAGSP